MYDAVVVGAGAAGGWAAKELCERGLTVLLLDAGPQLDSRRDFPLPAAPERRLLARLTAAVQGQPIQMRCAAFSARTRRFFVSDRENPYTTPARRPFNWFRGRQIGGRLHVWARVTPRLSDLELKAATHDGYGRDWPLSYDELAPYYDRVEEFLGVRDDLALTLEEKRFKAAVEDALPDRRVLSPRLARHEPDRQPSTIRAAERTGRLVLRPDCVVRSVSVDPATGKATGVSYVDRVTKESAETGAAVVVLCASTIETLRIMLNSTSPAHPRGLGNSSGRLGQGLMDHVLTGLGGPLRNYHPARPEAADPYDFGAVTGFQVPSSTNATTRHASFLRGWGFQGAIGRGAPVWYFLAHGEMLARDENRVMLDPATTDAWGVPAAHISCAPGPNEVAMAADQLETMRELAGAAGLEPRTTPSGKKLEAFAFRLWRRRLLSESGAFLPGTAAHEIGGAGIGDDPSESVLSKFNQCWEADNVFVTDGASFPSGCWQNVTLTIMALTVRACDYLVDEYAAGRL